MLSRDQAQTALKLMVIGVCMTYALSGSHPPAGAQGRAFVPVITAEDAVQDSKLSNLDDQIKREDTDLQRQIDDNKAANQRNWAAINAFKDDAAGRQGETRWLIAALGLMQGGIFATGRRSRKSEG